MDTHYNQMIEFYYMDKQINMKMGFMIFKVLVLL